MHPTATHTQFLQLRAQGLSFAAIARRLGVSKPTLMAWSRKAQPLLTARILEQQQRATYPLADTIAQELAALTRKHNFLKQELLSRVFSDVPTHQVETLAGEYNQKIQNLQRLLAGGGADCPQPPDSAGAECPHSTAPSPGTRTQSHPIEP